MTAGPELRARRPPGDSETSHPDETTTNKTTSPPKTAQWKALTFESLPHWMKDNEHILDHYRPQMSSLKDCLISAFSLFNIHNETINTLSHFIGFLLFLFITFYTLLYATRTPRFLPKHLLSSLSSPFPSIPKMPSSPTSADELFRHLRNSGKSFLKDHINLSQYSPHLINQAFDRLLREHRLGMIPMLLGSIFCMLSSTIYHTFWIHSKKALLWLGKLDYTCITLLISGHLLMGMQSGFFCRPTLGRKYQILIALATIAVVVVVFKKDFNTPQYRTKRTLVFCTFGAVAVVPMIHLSLLYGGQFYHPEWKGFVWSIGRTVVWYLVGAVLFATRYPECCRPGKHDKVGASHQLMHLTTIMGAFVHWYETLRNVSYRMEHGCTRSPL